MLKTAIRKLKTYEKCSTCHKRWASRDDFLSDSNVKIIGYQADFEDLVAGYFLFNHTCGTTLAIHVDGFTDLYDGPIFETNLMGSEDCPGYCVHKEALDRCLNKCECAFAREVIQIIKNWQKRGKE